MAMECKDFFDFLFDRTPHFDEDLLVDWFPTDDAWIGQVKADVWPARTGTTHTKDRLHMGAPDLSAAWSTFSVPEGGDGAGGVGDGCFTCNPTEVVVGWGSTRSTYGLKRKSYATRPFCFDQINTRAKANQQMAEIMKGLKEITKMVQSDYLRCAATQFNDTLYIVDDDSTTVAITGATITGQLLTIDLGAAGNLPESQLTLAWLEQFYDDLQFNGYFKSKFVPSGMFKLITDVGTARRLTSQNPALVSTFRHSDFEKGGAMFKFGVQRAVGNFAIAWDDCPARFYHQGEGVLRRVWPYQNASATIGVKKEFTTQYRKAPYQLDYLWHPEAMVRYVPELRSVSPEMPFLTRDVAGKWSFVGGNRDKTFVYINPDDSVACTIDNKRGNQGMFYADFMNGIEMQRPELTRAILSQRQPNCFVNDPTCATPPAYTVQTWDGNPPCEEA